jgi:predicted nucleic acid-binding protein
MTAVFADTFYWIALTNTQDQFHRQALELTRSLPEPRIVTSQPVLIEYLNFFAEWSSTFRRKATENARHMLASRSVRIIPHTDEFFQAGFDLYAARPDKGYSLTDCISMEMMRREGIDDVLTNDRHFEQEGFRVLFRAH